ncbi:MAG TPA: phosphoribosylaminoimidazolesuccinocarboxamide synthase [Acidimicrobiales bacterium]|nr:phosphoribosylaminoimidazolesuccinocarboxamide synthase [Acidimicrobiales bacterium]
MLPKIYSGKVRDIYDAGDGLLLMVTSDRISAFDVVMFEPIRDKGKVLTGVTAHWLAEVADIVPGHLVSTDPADFPPGATDLGDLAGRAMLVRRAEMLTIECIVRGYLAGSGWKEYTASGTVCGIELPPGLRQSDRLPEPLFTPSTKATADPLGQGAVVHDENISPEQAAEIVGAELYERAREISLAVYSRAAEAAAERGLIVADTKFELGLVDGELVLCDEVLTPDSSRFWDAATYEPGTSPPSFDKQPLRDWLEGSGWNKQPPPPFLPIDVVRETQARYVAAYERVTGKPFSEWAGEA